MNPQPKAPRDIEYRDVNIYLHRKVVRRADGSLGPGKRLFLGILIDKTVTPSEARKIAKRINEMADYLSGGGK